MSTPAAELGLDVHLSGRVDENIPRVTELLKEQGFGVLTTIAVHETLKARLGVERPPYVILGACNPGFAHQSLQIDPNVGLLLPCNVVLYEQADREGTTVSLINPQQMLGAMSNPALEPIAVEVGQRLARVAERLAEQAAETHA